MEKYPSLLDAINIYPNASEFNTNHISSKELNLIIKLHQADYHPHWETIVTTFNKRSMDQIRAILHYFNKASCMSNAENSILIEKVGEEPATLSSLSMFLNPIDHARLSRTAKNIILRTKEKSQEQEHPSISELELNMSQPSSCSIQ